MELEDINRDETCRLNIVKQKKLTEEDKEKHRTDDKPIESADEESRKLHNAKEITDVFARIMEDVPKLSLFKLISQLIIMTSAEVPRNMPLYRQDEKHDIVKEKREKNVSKDESASSSSDINSDNLVVLKPSEEYDSNDKFIPPPGFLLLDEITEVADFFGEDFSSDSSNEEIPKPVGESFETGEWLEAPSHTTSGDISEISSQSDNTADTGILEDVTLILKDLRARYGPEFINTIKCISESFFVRHDILAVLKTAIVNLENADSASIYFNEQPIRHNMDINVEETPQSDSKISIKESDQEDTVGEIKDLKVKNRSTIKNRELLNSRSKD